MAHSMLLQTISILLIMEYFLILISIESKLRERKREKERIQT